MNQPNLLSFPAPPPAPAPKRRSLAFNPKEFKVVALRECPTPAEMRIIDTPERVLGYWHDHVVTHPYYSSIDADRLGQPTNVAGLQGVD